MAIRLRTTLSERLKERLSAANLSQAELARRVGVAQPTIAKLVAGSSQNSVHLHAIATALGTTPAYLLGGIDDPNEGATPFHSFDMVLEASGIYLVPMKFYRSPEPRPPQGTPVFPVRRSDIAPLMEGEWHDLRADVMLGSDMAPIMQSGDIFVTDRCRKNIDEQDAIWLLSTDGYGMVRRVQILSKGKFRLYCDKKSVPPLEVQSSQFFIVGRVIWISGHR